MKTKFLNIFICTLLICLTSCEDVRFTAVTKEVFSGYVQKGPYINGSSVAISELDDSLNQTGRVYSTTITGNSGSFEQKQIELVSNYVQLKADGYYFNEVSGETSSGQLSLYALADISQVNSANVNVLTHLEKSRVEYLVQQKGLTFQAAKKQAQTEVLAIFSLALPTDSTSESLNLSASGDNNAILFAVSCILQGSSTTAEMSELMANIISDIKTDGTLDNAALGSMLLDNARLIDLAKVRSNMEERYVELGIAEYYIPDFEKQMQNFLTKSTYTPVKQITYPVSGVHGLNILTDTVHVCKPSTPYSMKADLPKGMSLRIVIKGGSGHWSYAIAPAPVNWTVGVYNSTTQSQQFDVTESNKLNDIYVQFSRVTDPITIEYYENNAIVPTKTKVITIEGTISNNSDVIVYPVDGIFVNWSNILNDSLKVTRGGKIYATAAFVPYQKSLKVILKGSAGSWILNPQSQTVYGWQISAYNSETQSQEITTSSVKSDVGITFPESKKVTVEIYENNATQPTRVRYLNE